MTERKPSALPMTVDADAGVARRPSTTVPPGRSVPRFAASWMMKSAARSFTDWPGFMNSALPRIVQPVSSEARFSLMRGVRPTAAATPLAKDKADLLVRVPNPELWAPP